MDAILDEYEYDPEKSAEVVLIQWANQFGAPEHPYGLPAVEQWLLWFDENVHVNQSSLTIHEVETPPPITSHRTLEKTQIRNIPEELRISLEHAMNQHRLGIFGKALSLLSEACNRLRSTGNEPTYIQGPASWAKMFTSVQAHPRPSGPILVYGIPYLIATKRRQMGVFSGPKPGRWTPLFLDS